MPKQRPWDTGQKEKFKLIIPGTEYFQALPLPAIHFHCPGSLMAPCCPFQS